jgi:hypothetical protein
VVDGVHTDYLAGTALVGGLLAIRPAPDAVVLAGFGNYGTAALKDYEGIWCSHCSSRGMLAQSRAPRGNSGPRQRPQVRHSAR